MRSLLTRSFLLGTFLLAACAPQQTPTGNPAAPAAPTGPRKAENQKLIYAIGAYPSTLSIEGAASIFTFHFQFDSLLTFGENFEIKPGVAEKWELSPDGKQWRFTLRKDLKFGNGEPLKASDAVASIKTLATPAPSNTVGAQLLFMDKTNPAVAIDEYTLGINMLQKDYSLPYVAPNIFIQSEKAVTAAGGQKDFGIKPTGGGTGPYEVAEIKQGDFVRFQLKPGKHPYRTPTLTDITLKVVPELSARTNGLRTGDLDMLINVTDPETGNKMKAEGFIVDAASSSYTSIIFDQKTIKGTPIEDRKVRLAMNYAIDKAGLANTLYRGFGQPIGQLSVPGSLNYNTTVQPVPYDPARAKALLAEAGYPNGFTLQGLDYALGDPVTQQLFQIIQDQHRAVGITYQIYGNEFANYVAIALGQKPRREMISAGGANPNGIFSFSWQFLKCSNPPTIQIWCVQKMDDLLTAAYAEPEAAKRNQLLKDASAAWADEYPQIFLTSAPDLAVMGPKIKGFKRAVPSYYMLDSVYREG